MFKTLLSFLVFQAFGHLKAAAETEKLIVISGLKMQKFDAGETVHERDERSDVYFIFEGKIRIDMQDQHGEFAFFRLSLSGFLHRLVFSPDGHAAAGDDDRNAKEPTRADARACIHGI